MTDDATINALVAEHVMGWERVDIRDAWVPVEGDIGERPIHARWRDPNTLLKDSHRLHEHPPDACNDGNVMLRVIEAMRERGFGVYTVSWKDRLIATVEIDDGDRIKQLAHIEADLLPRAVALAALKALGVEVPA